MDFSYTEKEEAFRQEVHDLLEEVLPSDWAEKCLMWPGGWGTFIGEDPYIKKAWRRMTEKG